ncbi:MAG: hypothetical protein CL920_35845, partial [Deltaproteobacteria bacterium]|nr:hypothetical protein [Deltaproteobacteria bacterium]
QGGEFVEVDDCKRRRKKPTESSKAKKNPRIWPCHIRLEEGDCRVESGEFAETQVQRPPDPMLSISRVYRLNGPSSRKD